MEYRRTIDGTMYAKLGEYPTIIDNEDRVFCAFSSDKNTLNPQYLLDKFNNKESEIIDEKQWKEIIKEWCDGRINKCLIK